MHRAWPHGGQAPRRQLARWLARQVGPTKVKPCRHRVGHRVPCKRRSPLQLVRSYNIPTDDPSYVRLLNWSWNLAYASEYHVWPAAAAGAWVLLAEGGAALYR